MSSPVIPTAPLEVDRSSSQSALSERSDRWNGRGWWTCVLASVVMTVALLQFNLELLPGLPDVFPGSSQYACGRRSPGSVLQSRRVSFYLYLLCRRSSRVDFDWRLGGGCVSAASFCCWLTPSP